MVKTKMKKGRASRTRRGKTGASRKILKSTSGFKGFKGSKKHKSIEQIVLKSAIEVVRKGEGSLFVIGEGVKYERLLHQKLKPFSVFDAGAEKTLVGLAIVDGAVIITPEGIVKEYGVLIKNTRAFKGFGTRHAAAVTAAKSGNTVILCSEEERKIKIFRSGRLVMQVDALEKGIEKKVPEISTMLESGEVKDLLASLGMGFLGTIGVGALVPALGVALIPGVIVFGGSYYAIKKLIEAHTK
jgi:hypothetical protein